MIYPVVRHSLLATISTVLWGFGAVAEIPTLQTRLQNLMAQLQLGPEAAPSQIWVLGSEGGMHGLGNGDLVFWRDPAGKTRGLRIAPHTRVEPNTVARAKTLSPAQAQIWLQWLKRLSTADDTPAARLDAYRYTLYRLTRQTTGAFRWLKIRTLEDTPTGRASSAGEPPAESFIPWVVELGL